MSEDQDERIGALLRGDAPPERDALFRLGVLQRRERRRFQRRSVILIAAAALLAVVLFAGFIAAGPLVTFSIALLCAAVAGACLLSVSGVLQLLRRLRGATAGKN